MCLTNPGRSTGFRPVQAPSDDRHVMCPAKITSRFPLTIAVLPAATDVGGDQVDWGRTLRWDREVVTGG